MANDKQKLAREAQSQLRKAGDHAKKAGQIFKLIGDPDGEKVSKKVSDASEEGDKYVDRRLGGAQNGG